MLVCSFESSKFFQHCASDSAGEAFSERKSKQFVPRASWLFAYDFFKPFGRIWVKPLQLPRSAYKAHAELRFCNEIADAFGEGVYDLRICNAWFLIHKKE